MTLMSPESNKVNLKNESYQCHQIFARAKYESWYLKELFLLCLVSPRNSSKKKFGTLVSFGFFVLQDNRARKIISKERRRI